MVFRDAIQNVPSYHVIRETRLRQMKKYYFFGQKATFHKKSVMLLAMHTEQKKFRYQSIYVTPATIQTNKS